LLSSTRRGTHSRSQSNPDGTLIRGCNANLASTFLPSHDFSIAARLAFERSRRNEKNASFRSSVEEKLSNNGRIAIRHSGCFNPAEAALRIQLKREKQDRLTEFDESARRSRFTEKLNAKQMLIHFEYSLRRAVEFVVYYESRVILQLASSHVVNHIYYACKHQCSPEVKSSSNLVFRRSFRVSYTTTDTARELQCLEIERLGRIRYEKGKDCDCGNDCVAECALKKSSAHKIRNVLKSRL
jgi:hypothetical protein